MNKAAIPNPALKAFERLIGEWDTEGSHPMVPGTVLRGHASVKWMEGGAFVIMHAEVFDERFPAGISIFGSDNELNKYTMLYFDERSVSRTQEVSYEGNIMKWWRNAPGFSQRYTFTFTDDGNTINSQGELSEDDKTWKKDLDLTYTRVGKK